MRGTDPLSRLVHYPIEITPPLLECWHDGTVPYVQERSSQRAGPEVLLVALVHGNEYSGACVLHDLLASQLLPQAGRITMMFANMVAFQSFDAKRPDASRYVDEDFNRVWSAEALDSGRSSLELQRARSLRPYVARATHLLDLHSMHEPCEPLLVTGMMPHHVAFAQSLGSAGQVVMDAGHKDGVRMRDYGDFSREQSDKIALLLEAGQHWQAASVQVARDITLRFLLRAGSINLRDVQAAGLQSWLLPDQPSKAPLVVTHTVVAKSMQFEFAAPFTGGELLPKAGTLIAYDDAHPITTPYDNCTLVMPSLRQLRPGVTTVRLAQRSTVLSG